jgi:glycosyltransferase 2 family protein
MASRSGGLRLTGGWLMRAGGSALVLAILFRILPLGEVASAFARVPPGLFFATLALFLLGHAAAAGKWLMLLGGGLPYGQALRAHLAGLAANLCLPGMAGGDVVRAGLVVGRAGDLAAVAAASLADRLIDTASLALLAGIGLILVAGDGTAGGTGLVIEAGGLLLVMVAGAFWLFPRLMPGLARRLPFLPGLGLLLRLATAFGGLARRPAALGAALLLSLAIQAGFTLLAMRLADAIGIAAPFGAWAFAWSLAKILAVLPVSLGGLGVREAGLAALMAPFGLPAAGVVAASLLWQAVLLCGGGAGGLVWALTGRAGARAAAARPAAEQGQA